MISNKVTLRDNAQIVYIILEYKYREGIAKFLRFIGKKPTASTGIGGFPTLGYGELDDNGFWRYPLPDEVSKD